MFLFVALGRTWWCTFTGADNRTLLTVIMGATFTRCNWTSAGTGNDCKGTKAALCCWLVAGMLETGMLALFATGMGLANWEKWAGWPLCIWIAGPRSVTTWVSAGTRLAGLIVKRADRWLVLLLLRDTDALLELLAGDEEVNNASWLPVGVPCGRPA